MNLLETLHQEIIESDWTKYFKGGCSMTYPTYEEIKAEQEMIKKAELENWQLANNIDPWDYED